jgi:hypothetical protein
VSEHEYKPNSHKYREGQTDVPAERKKVEKVIKGTAKTRKKSEIRKLTDVLVAEDVGIVKTRLVADLLIPAIKNTILDLIVEGATMILKGESRRSSEQRSGVGYVSYRRYGDRDHDDRRESGIRSGYSHDDIVLDYRDEAEEVLARMDELIETYGFVTVADMYDLVGKTCHYTDNKYGWTNLRSAEPVRVLGGGYRLKLPRAFPID